MAWRAETPCGAFGLGHCGWNGKLAAIRYRFQCREWSAATGLVNFRMRWYDSVTGRWLSKDPIGLNGGLNLYAFCNGDPVNYLDADGTLLVPFLMNSLVAAGIAATNGKERCYGVAFDGIVFIGNTVTVGKYFGQNLPVESSVIGFPTYAGVNWYHNHPTDQTVEEFVAEAKKWADTDYVLALYRGEALPEEEKEKVIEKVTYYTGVSREYLVRHGLKIDDDDYRQEVLKRQGKGVSRYDGRMTRPLLEPEVVEQKEGLWDDATADRYDAYFYAALTGDLLPKLGVKLDRNYVNMTMYYKNWDKEESMGTTGQQLRNAMTRRPGMRVFFTNGWFDLCTEFGFVYHTLDHAGLPKDRVFVKGYKSGHMIYIGEENIHELCEDIRAFVEGNDPTK